MGCYFFFFYMSYPIFLGGKGSRLWELGLLHRNVTHCHCSEGNVVHPNSCIASPVFAAAPAPIGICYGRLANNRPSTAVNLLKSNGITTVRLFNTDLDTLTSFSGTDISLMIGVPNELLPFLATTTIDPSLQWLQSNIFSNISPTQIKYIVVGNEILLKDLFYTPYLVPAMNNLYIALQTLGLSDTIKLSTSHAASVLMNSYPPSASSFDPNHQSIMGPLLQFLKDTGSPLMVNVYPFFSFTNNPQFVSLDCVHVMVNGKVHVETSMVRFAIDGQW
ncbi:glucan endo-1,3-beta-glucosidase-like [Camellia sinensis]|uniref:glucan endo-1,3-beta-glucosidase-like n=1 Tax=Camellia sinensis TaxID=4442 RepID=UPI001036ABF0|nr:glucan endo-1,3-beta-glucosidase-like [Camellia sinensis]